MNRLFKVFSILSVAMCLLVVACGSSSPSDVVKKYHAAAQKGDVETVKKFVTPEASALFALVNSEQMKEATTKQGGIKKISHTINGDDATVTVTYEKNEKEETIKMKKIDGKWLISSGK